MSSTDSRLTDMEIRLMHQEAALESLNEVVVTLQRRASALEDEIKVLREHMQTNTPAPVASGSEETPPPHY